MPGVEDLVGATPWGAAAQLAGGLIGGGIGIAQRAQAKKWLKNHPQPIEAIPAEQLQNQELARIRANTGMPSEQYNNAIKSIQRQQLMALRGAQDRKGGLALLGGINEYGNDAVGNLNAQDAQMRVNAEGQLINVNNQVANTKRDLFQKNVRDKYLRDYDYNMGVKGAGNQNLVGGIDKSLAGLFGSAGGSGLVGRSSGGSGDGISTDWLMNNQYQTGRRY